MSSNNDFSCYVSSYIVELDYSRRKKALSPQKVSLFGMAETECRKRFLFRLVQVFKYINIDKADNLPIQLG